MELPLYIIDAFTEKSFGGNPAAVCPLAKWIGDDLLQQIAAENNLSETAFFVGEADGFRLRWFTPKVEVGICGHATLASAHVLFQYLNYQEEEIRFNTASGVLKVNKRDGLLVMDFPARYPISISAPDRLIQGLGATPTEVLQAENTYMCVFDEEEQVAGLTPDLGLIEQLEMARVIVTAPGRESDFVSRFFAPRVGIPEDPVTGSAHCTLVPYWAGRLEKRRLFARQLSRRQGELHCELMGDRVTIAGQAVTYAVGKIYLAQ